MSKNCWVSLRYCFAALMCASAVGQNNYQGAPRLSGYPNDGHVTQLADRFDKAGNMYGSDAGRWQSDWLRRSGLRHWSMSFHPTGKAIGRRAFFITFAQISMDCHVWMAHTHLHGLTIDQQAICMGSHSVGGTGYVYLAGPGVAFELSPPKEKGRAIVDRDCALQLLQSVRKRHLAWMDGFGFPSQPLVFDGAGDLIWS